MNFTNWDTRTCIQRARYFDMYCHVIIHWQNESNQKGRDKRRQIEREERSRMRILRSDKQRSIRKSSKELAPPLAIGSQ